MKTLAKIIKYGMQITFFLVVVDLIAVVITFFLAGIVTMMIIPDRHTAQQFDAVFWPVLKWVWITIIGLLSLCWLYTWAEKRSEP